MERTELQRLLNDGINAIRNGDRERGRDLLLQVVEADDRLEPAWLWLSQAVDDPADKLMALENALVLNPANAQVQAQAQQLRKQLGIEEEARTKDQGSRPKDSSPNSQAQRARNPNPSTSLHPAQFAGQVTSNQQSEIRNQQSLASSR